MKKIVIALSLVLAAALSTPCDDGKDKVLPDGTKVFGERTLPDGTVKIERKEFPDGRKHFDVTVLPNGTRKIGRVEFSDGEKSFEVTIRPDGTDSTVRTERPSGEVQFDCSSLKDGTKRAVRIQSPSGEMQFDVSWLKDGTIKIGRIEFQNGQKKYDLTAFPDGTIKIARLEFPNGQKNFGLTLRPDGSASAQRMELADGKKQYDVTILPDGTTKIARIELPSGETHFDVTQRPDGTETVGRVTKPDGTSTASTGVGTADPQPQQPAVGTRESASAQGPQTPQKETHREGVPALTKEPAAPGPFGFRRGMTREQIIKLVGKAAIDSAQTQDDILAVRKAPAPDPAFGEYWLIISPTEGLLKVTGVGITVNADSYGTELRAAFMNAVAGVTRKYGDTKGKADGCIPHPKNSTEAHFGCLYPDSYLLDINNGAPVARVWMESLKARGPRSDRVVYVRVSPYVEKLKYFDPLIKASMFRKLGLSIAGASGYLLVEYAFDGFDEYLVSSGQAPDPATVQPTIPYGAIQ